MKVDNHTPLRPGQIESRDATRQTREAPAAQQDTPEAATTTHLRQGATDASQDIDTARVDELRAAIRDGQLEIKPERIADGLIASVQDLLADEGDAQ
ncbi:flagellar biosynthesis anti-sigma factor FlgM [Halomonas getboli]|uniref:flagellar biosynthesis anti-sigma factor FlgM n=1 Tax=Halomonas getboli TaxID=2935862 RepID=UPI001FFFB0B9|nr:flagellar biosynthesis anti-sigma factor FlgM [Halomonas getboli]